MIVSGTGLIATALKSQLDEGLLGYVFARGVSNSMETDEDQYERELASLSFALIDTTGPFWYISSSAAADPVTRYGRHKAQCEALVFAAGGASIRLGNVVGPGGHPNQLVPSLVRQIKAGVVMVQHGATRDIIDVEDAARLILQVTRGPLMWLSTVGSGISTPVSELVDEMCLILDLQPAVLLVAGGHAQKLDVPAFAPGYPFRVLKRYVR